MTRPDLATLAPSNLDPLRRAWIDPRRSSAVLRTLLPAFKAARNRCSTSTARRPAKALSARSHKPGADSFLDNRNAPSR
jgi:hypothetical protein